MRPCPCDTPVCNHLSLRHFLISRQRIYSLLGVYSFSCSVFMNVNVNTTFFLHIGYFSYFNVNSQWNPCESPSDSISSTSAGLQLIVGFFLNKYFLNDICVLLNFYLYFTKMQLLKFLPKNNNRVIFYY